MFDLKWEKKIWLTVLLFQNIKSQDNKLFPAIISKNKL